MQVRSQVHCAGVLGPLAGPLAKLRLILVSVLQTTLVILGSNWNPAAARGPCFGHLLADKSGWTKNTPTGSASPGCGRAQEFCSASLKDMQMQFYVHCGDVFGPLAAPLAKLRLILASVLQTTPVIFDSEWDSASARGPQCEHLLDDQSGWTKTTPTGSASPWCSGALDFCPGQLHYTPSWSFVHFGGVLELQVPCSPLDSTKSPPPFPPRLLQRAGRS